MLEAVLAEAQARGWIGKAPLSETIAHAVGFAGCVDTAPSLFLDLGSGGGVPGLVLALEWPSARGVLVETSAHRSEFLQAAVKRLNVDDRIEVLHERAELAARRPELRAHCDVVTARGFAIPPVTAECAAPLLKVGGLLAVSDPPQGERSVDRWPEEPLALLGLSPGSLVTSPFTYQLLEQTTLCPEKYPRRPGIPEKRSLY